MEDTRRPTYDELLAENAQLKIKAARVDELERQVAELKAQVDKLTKMLFGKKSEKSKKDKGKKSKPASDEPKSKRNKNGGGGRKSFPPEIPRRDVHVPLHPDECRCHICGQEYESMGVEITEVLNIIPTQADETEVFLSRQ